MDTPRPTALIVDDTPLALRLGQAILEKEGLRVLATAKWSDVADLLFRDEVDVVFVDVNMPGLQGDRLVEILRGTRRGRQTRIVLLSNLPPETLREKAQTSGADDWIQKPLSGESVREKLRKFGLA